MDEHGILIVGDGKSIWFDSRPLTQQIAKNHVVTSGDKTVVRRRIW